MMDKVPLEGKADAHRLESTGSSRVATYRSGEAENGKWRKADDTSYCLDMLTRALGGEQFAQRWFQRRFSHIVLASLKRHPGRKAVCAVYSEAYLLEKTFQHLWHTQIDHSHNEFSTINAIKQYVCASLNAVMLEALRLMNEDRAKLSTPSSRQESTGERPAEARLLWEKIEHILASERERRLAYLLFVSALKPADIAHSFPQEFRDTHEIIALRLTIIEHLMG